EVNCVACLYTDATHAATPWKSTTGDGPPPATITCTQQLPPPSPPETWVVTLFVHRTVGGSETLQYGGGPVTGLEVDYANQKTGDPVFRLLSPNGPVICPATITIP